MSEKGGRYGKPYDHIDDAAAAALMLLARQPRVDKQEYMGLLIKGEDGKYYRTDLQTQGNSMESEWRGYPDGDLAGIVHNHPESRKGMNDHDYGPRAFSETDVGMAKGNNVPSYIAKMVQDELPVESRYTPGVTEVVGAPIPGRSTKEKVGMGEPFLAQFPWDEFKEHLMRKLLDRAPTDPRGLTR